MASTWTVRTVYESRQPVDGVAVSPSNPAEVAFVGSALAGDTWDGTVGVLRLRDDSEGEDIVCPGAAALPCGVSAVCWLGADVVAPGLSIEDALLDAPSARDRYFRVPSILGGDQ